jgi:hypothetical protein
MFAIAAESLGIPMVKPYLGIKNGVFEDKSAKEGANFAVIGATALDVSFFEERGVLNYNNNYSLSVQLNWFKEFLPSLCNSSKSKFSLIIVIIITNLPVENVEVEHLHL